jgi:hypothetical protein
MTAVFDCRLAGALMVPHRTGKIVTIAPMSSFRGGFALTVDGGWRGR